MAFLEDDKPKKPMVHDVGQDLSMLSIDELTDRVALLREEIVRIETEIAAKARSRSAADSFFKS